MPVESGEYKLDRSISPFVPQHDMDVGRLFGLMAKAIELRGDIDSSQGDLDEEQIGDKDHEIHQIVKEIALGLSGKKYVRKE